MKKVTQMIVGCASISALMLLTAGAADAMAGERAFCDHVRAGSLYR